MHVTEAQGSVRRVRLLEVVKLRSRKDEEEGERFLAHSCCVTVKCDAIKCTQVVTCTKQYITHVLYEFY